MRRTKQILATGWRSSVDTELSTKNGVPPEHGYRNRNDPELMLTWLGEVLTAVELQCAKEFIRQNGKLPPTQAATDASVTK